MTYMYGMLLSFNLAKIPFIDLCRIKKIIQSFDFTQKSLYSWEKIFMLKNKETVLLQITSELDSTYTTNIYSNDFEKNLLYSDNFCSCQDLTIYLESITFNSNHQNSVSFFKNMIKYLSC